MTWHVDGPTWQAYAGGRLNPAAEAAVETHVTACAVCRDGARALAPDPEPLWRSVHAEISRPRLPAPLRVLARIGVAQDDLVVMATARDLLLSWSVAVGAAIFCAVVSGLAPLHLPGGAPALFLILAPLVPVLAVVATYDTTDPFREITDALPFSTLRIALLRTVAALTAAVPLTVAVALIVPTLQSYFAAWLLPGLTLTALALILLTWLTPWVTSGVVGGGWLVAASVATGSGGIDIVGSAGGQAGFAVAVAVLGALLVRISIGRHPRRVAR